MKKMTKIFVEICGVLATIILCFLLLNFIFNILHIGLIVSDSMMPALAVNSTHLFLSSRSGFVDDYQIGDIVAYNSASDKLPIVHRIKAKLGGEYLVCGDNPEWRICEWIVKDKILALLLF